jgi:hypothetical protein
LLLVNYAQLSIAEGGGSSSPPTARALQQRIMMAID